MSRERDNFKRKKRHNQTGKVRERLQRNLPPIEPIKEYASTGVGHGLDPLNVEMYPGAYDTEAEAGAVKSAIESDQPLTIQKFPLDQWKLVYDERTRAEWFELNSRTGTEVYLFANDCNKNLVPTFQIGSRVTTFTVPNPAPERITPYITHSSLLAAVTVDDWLFFRSPFVSVERLNESRLRGRLTRPI